MSLPEKKYRIHIKNLYSDTEAEALSDRFAWDIYDIVMNPRATGKSSPTECWLKNATGEREVDTFIQQWNGKNVCGSNIECEKEEDELELCNKFQYGRCVKTEERCHWEHIKCTAHGKCAATCPYGHPAGMKAERPDADSKSHLSLMIEFYLSRTSWAKPTLVVYCRSDHELSNQNDRISISGNTTKSCSTIALEGEQYLC